MQLSAIMTDHWREDFSFGRHTGAEEGDVASAAQLVGGAGDVSSTTRKDRCVCKRSAGWGAEKLGMELPPVVTGEKVYPNRRCANLIRSSSEGD